MPAYRFSWDAFDEQTITALALELGYTGDLNTARDWLEANYKRPNDDFVRHTKQALAKTWLPKYRGTRLIVERLMDSGIGPLGGTPRSDEGAARYIEKCRNSGTLRRLVLEALHRYGDQDRKKDDESEDNESFVPRFAVLKPSEQPGDGRSPHHYQLEAWNRLSAHLAEAESTGQFGGLLVMPTGSGKTYTTVRWLMQSVVNRGGRVLWLAHRQELLTQAAREFHALAALVTTRERLRVRIVSNAHCATTQIDPADDILVCSIASLARRADIVDAMARDKNLFVVIDEAHHAPAKSYRSVLAALAERGVRRVLGITATPTRTAEDERPILARLFPGGILYQTQFRDLVERGFLARPNPVRVITQADVEAGTTSADLSHLARFGELSEEWLDRIADMAIRNEIILQHYLENRERYGKTLIFALNVRHAALLAERLKTQGIAAEYVASWSPDGERANNAEIIQRFRDRQGGIDVLVNVQMLTEGVDVPSVQTVFLTRPTNSEILLRQMVGRALRGPAVGGNKEAYLVSFEDHWERFREWQSQFDLVPDLIPRETPPGKEVQSPLFELIPWEVIRKAAQVIIDSGIKFQADAFDVVPHGWYVLDRIDDGEAVHQTIAVFEHQRPSWEACIAYLLKLTEAELNDEELLQRLDDEFFFDCEPPRSARHEILQVLEHVRAGGGAPDYKVVAERELCEPHALAKHIVDNDLGERKKQELLEQRYTKLAQAIYPTMRDFRAAIEDAVYEIFDPNASTRRTRGVPVFQPRPEDQLAPGPKHDLERLMEEVLDQGSKLLGVPLQYTGTLLWSKRIIKGWFGMAFLEQNEIRINRLLDSPDIDEATLRFLLWHEFLHIYLQQGHTKVFREKERLWPDCVHADRVMDSLNERFGVQYW